MKAQLFYEFSERWQADRFIADVNSGAVDDVKAKLYRGDFSAQVIYYIDNSAGFDARAGELDALAERYGGREVSEYE